MILRRGIYSQYQEQGKDALHFDSTYSEKVNLPTSFITSTRTVSFWVNPDVTTFNGQARQFLATQYGGSGQRTFYVEFPIGTQIFFTKKAESVTFQAETGVTIYSVDDLLEMGRRFCGASLLKIGTDAWNLIGELV